MNSNKNPTRGPPPEIISKAIEIFRERDRKRADFIERYGYIRPPQGVLLGGRMMCVVGGGIFRQAREGGYNVVNLIHDYALMFFGDDYLRTEERKPIVARHTALQWMQTYVDYLESFERDQDHQPNAAQIGVGAAWFRFAYDLFTIADNSTLQAPLRLRLLDPATFQAARHELRVAAICAVAGFDLHYEDEADNSRTHPEFTATDRLSSARIAVEAKSRHRHGVQGFSGGLDIKPGDRVSIRDMVIQSYQKQSELPLYAFIDVNLPHASTPESRAKWLREIDDTMSDLAREGYANPCPVNAVFFCNDPSHYVGAGEIGQAADSLWIAHYTPPEPRVPHPETDMTARFMKAYRQRVAPPDRFPNPNDW